MAAARARLAAEGVVVLYEDHLLLGISKGAGVLSQGGPTGERSLVEMIDEYRREAEGKAGKAFVGLVHRLDRNVSGAMVVAKSSKAASRLSAAFRSREGVVKHYLAWTEGVGSLDGEMTVHSLLWRDEKTRVTHEWPGEGVEGCDGRLFIERVVCARGFRRHVVRLDTGITHQIRAQLAGRKMPIVGDAKYGGPPAPRAAKFARDRIALHAWRLTVPHPVGGAPLTIEAPVPDDLRRLDRALRLAPPVA